MLPETAFHKRSGNLPFLIVNGSYYNISSSKAVDGDYLVVWGVRFPLKKGMGIQEEEEAYMRRNSQTFTEFKTELERRIKSSEGNGIEDIKEDIRVKGDIYFFLNFICPCYDNQRPQLNFGAPRQGVAPEKEACIMMDILSHDCAVINSSIFPLAPLREPVVQPEDAIFIRLGGRDYTLGQKEKTADEIESVFKGIIEKRLKMQLIKEIEEFRYIAARVYELARGIEFSLKEAGASQYAYCYEYKRMGYDTSLKRVYCLIPAHYNRTSGKKYKEGQSAVTLPLNQGVLGDNLMFAQRLDRNHPFELYTHTHPCLEVPLRGETLADKVEYLCTAAHIIHQNKAFYE